MMDSGVGFVRIPILWRAGRAAGMAECPAVAQRCSRWICYSRYLYLSPRRSLPPTCTYTLDTIKMAPVTITEFSVHGEWPGCSIECSGKASPSAFQSGLAWSRSSFGPLTDGLVSLPQGIKLTFRHPIPHRKLSEEAPWLPH